jgi:Asp-tRNA(Asn)/Glu-tRNA(Gln) amidotransferase A subunit family amidase
LPPGAYAEELRHMAERRREFAGWFGAYDAILTPTVAYRRSRSPRSTTPRPIPAS